MVVGKYCSYDCILMIARHRRFGSMHYLAQVCNLSHIMSCSLYDLPPYQSHWSLQYLCYMVGTCMSSREATELDGGVIAASSRRGTAARAEDVCQHTASHRSVRQSMEHAYSCLR